MEITYLVTSIMTALGTVGAVVAAVALGLREQKRGNAERERIAEESARVQASHITCWDVTRTLHHVYPDGSLGAAEGRERQVSVQNVSSAPVFNVRVFGRDGDVLVQYMMLLPTPVPSVQIVPIESKWDVSRLALMEFRDAAGVDWIRSESGELARKAASLNA